MKAPRVPVAVLAPLLVLAAACSSAEGSKTSAPADGEDEGFPEIAGDGTGASEDPVKTGGDAGASRATYPAGPYGFTVGAKIGDVTAKGHRFTTKSTATPALEDVSLQSVRAANPSCKCMLVNVAAVWCSTCTEEQPVLKKLVAEDPSFCVVEMLQEGAKENSVTSEAELKAWVERHGVNFPVTLGTSAGKHYIDEHQSAPVNVMVKADTMTIVGVSADSIDLDPLLAACRK